MPRTKISDTVPPKITSSKAEAAANFDDIDEGDKKPVVKTRKVANKDYLQQYEFHKETGRPYFQLSGVPYVEPDSESDAAKMKAHLLKQDKVRIFIPRDGKEPKSVLKSVNLNGYRLDFPKSTYIEVPEQVADLLKDSLEQTESALGQFSIDDDEKKGKALSR